MPDAGSATTQVKGDGPGASDSKSPTAEAKSAGDAVPPVARAGGSSSRPEREPRPVGSSTKSSAGVIRPLPDGTGAGAASPAKVDRRIVGETPSTPAVKLSGLAPSFEIVSTCVSVPPKKSVDAS